VDVGEGKALLVREQGQYYAVGHKCTHYGAPLASGALYNGRVRCPWHGACFNVKTGDIEDFPGLDSIPKFEVNCLIVLTLKGVTAGVVVWRGWDVLPFTVINCIYRVAIYECIICV